MANKMLIDASHPEETRVVVLRGNRVEEFDFEAASKKQLRGNIYLAKVMRVEPSLQAAFVDYGGNRHGFLAFTEIHPDYYQIPVADRQSLIEEEARAQRDEEEDAARSPRRSRRFRRGDRNGHRAEKRRDSDPSLSEPYAGEASVDAAASSGLEEIEEAPAESFAAERDVEAPGLVPEESARGPHHDIGAQLESLGPEDTGNVPALSDGAAEPAFEAADDALFGQEGDNRGPVPETDHPLHEASFAGGDAAAVETDRAAPEPAERGDENGDAGAEDEDESAEIEQLGGDAMEEMPSRPHRYRKQYKIQEVIKRRQVLLVQVVKEERGNKGAALTTYLSLAGRYSVLMPNTARGGGISRKITDSSDRQRLKSIAQELDVPDGMGVIVRTAGAARTKAEVKRDFEYLLRMWETVRETTLQSTAPTLVYEEGSLIKRAIRDLYNKDIDEVVVAGDDGYREAKEFMRLLMPSHAKMVQPYRDPQPMFAKSGAEAQLDAMFSNQVTLKSGGYIVINQTEALVAIDVNSGRSTREHNIEDTALRTNLEAADEIARQLRLRDLAGLIVIDFIDMEENRNNRTVERRLKDALKNDRARIQIGRMSHFGLLEMSRQRMRTGVIEGSTVVCPHCAGAGMVRSTSSIALHVLRALEDALIRNASYDIAVKTRTAVALYILNQKRSHLRDLEKRFGVSLTIAADDELSGTNYYALERGEAAAGAKETRASQPKETANAALAESFFDETAAPEESRFEAAETDEALDPDATRRDGETEAEGRQRRRRRRRRGRGGDREGSGIAPNAPQPPDDALEAMTKIGGLQPAPAFESEAGTGETDFPGTDEKWVGHPVAERRSRRDERRPRKTPGPTDAEPADAVPLEFALASGLEPELPDLSDRRGMGESRSPAGRARRSRRAPREPRGAPRRDAPPADAFTAGELPDQPHGLDIAPPQGDEGEGTAPLVNAKEDARETSPALPPETYGTPRQDEIPERLSNEPAQPDALDPARPKRSGWWQRARASWRG
ncbi:MAG TPA: Rne/Rng family ribonuclease [Methylocella sp.]|nr:Rne/Rng family ribonuclease [Methylocella sp.]